MHDHLKKFVTNCLAAIKKEGKKYDVVYSHYWDAGFTYLANNDLQFDVYVGTSITEGQDILLGLGLSYRIKPKQ